MRVRCYAAIKRCRNWFEMVGERSNDERMRGPSLSLMLIAAQGAAEGAPRGGQSSAHVPSRGFFSRLTRVENFLERGPIETGTVLDSSYMYDVTCYRPRVYFVSV